MDSKISLAKTQADIRAALKSWHETDTDVSPISYLQLFQRAQAQEASSTRQATNKVLLDALGILAIEHKPEADLLRKRFFGSWKSVFRAGFLLPHAGEMEGRTKNAVRW